MQPIPAPMTAATDISVNVTHGNQNAYGSGCATPEGDVVMRVEVKSSEATKPRSHEATKPRSHEATKPAAAALAFTGSSDTPSYVLIGIAAIVVGAVLVVAARRRSKVL